ncbi:MAG: tetratricopeptide repeat protein [Robiginitomaculum sp.]
MTRYFLSFLLLLGFYSAPAMVTAQIVEPEPEVEAGPELGVERYDIIIPDGDETTPKPVEPSPLGQATMAEGMDDIRADIIISNDAERTQKLDDLFDSLRDTKDAEEANLVAEEIWSIWLRSGSASIDYVLARGNDAYKMGDLALAGRMYDHVIRLQPDYAEGWVRAGRLAIDEGELMRAQHDVAQALIYEPRHFYALWTLGNIFEQLGQRDEAFEAYSEAHKLYPALKAVKDRIEYLSDAVEGESL